MNKHLITFLLLFFIENLFANSAFSPIPQQIDFNKEKALLGKKLFLDTRLSSDNSVSCLNCHLLNDGGDDNLATSIGVKGRVGSINAPTVYNSFFNLAQNWNGKAKNLRDHVKLPLKNRVVMEGDFNKIIELLSKDSEYSEKFKSVYLGEISEFTISDAIAEFEKALITPNSKFDKFLRGDNSALNKIEKEGFKNFNLKGCASCHNGINLGGNLYQKAGIFDKFPQIEGKEFLGRYSLTKDEKDKYFVKVPTLRNIALTAPYFHHGQTKDLLTAIYQMAYYQLGIVLTKKEAKSIEAFLKTLTGEVPEIAK